jgi:predicted TIM-barrel fold metal-dependent hydrolase
MTRNCLPPSADYTSVNFSVPAGACDSHVHIFGPFTQFPLAEDRSYTPQEFLPDQFIAHLDRIGFTRGVLVTASVCGTNNGSLLQGLEKYPDRFRGVVVPDINVTDHELDRWHALGVRGARFNLLQIEGKPMYRNGVGLEVLKKLAPKFAERGWHAQIWAHAPDLPELAPQLLPLGLPLVIDHMGRMNTSHGFNNPGFQFLCRLLAEGKGWVKISGADRIGDVSKGYEDVDPFAKALLAANPENIVWGTDWPHINYFDSALVPDDGKLVNLLSRWIDQPKDLERVLVANPARLYDFPKL